MSGPVRSVLRQSASMDDYTRDRRNSVRFADQAAPSQALETFQQLAIQQHPNLQQQQQQAGAVLRSPLQVPQQQQQQQQSHQGYYPCPSMTATASQLGNPQVGYNHASNNASAGASNVSANNNGATTGATGSMQQQPQAAPGSPPQVSPLSPSQLSSFALQIAAQQQQQPVQQQQFVFQGTSNQQQQQPVLSPTLTSTHSPQVMFNYSATGSAQQPQHVVPHGWQQQQAQQQQTSPLAPIFVKNNDQFSPLSIANTDDPKWHKWVELINQYWNEMAALDEQSRFQMICNLSILAAEKE